MQTRAFLRPGLFKRPLQQMPISVTPFFGGMTAAMRLPRTIIQPFGMQSFSSQMQQETFSQRLDRIKKEALIGGG